jgi:hypothetical protein
MDPFAKKMWRFGWTFFAGMVIAFLAMSAVYFHARPQCSDRVVSSATSPDQKWIATVMERRCGEEAPFITHANLRLASQPEHRGYFSGRDDDGEILAVEQDAQATGLTVQWTSASALLVRCAHCVKQNVQREMAWGPLHITYEFSPVPEKPGH